MLGIGVISFDRPGYLRALVSSLRAQSDDLNSVGFHLFQDGAVNRFSGAQRATQQKIDAAVRVWEIAGLPNSEKHIRHENVSVGINQYEAVELMVERYDQIVMLEDDVVLSPYWLRLVRILFSELDSHPDVYGFSTAFRRQCGVEEINDNLHRVAYGTPHWWMIAFTPDRWQRIKPHFLEYYELIRYEDYAKIPHDKITNLYKQKGWTQNATSQDGGKDMAVHAAGMKRAVLAVNRGLSIGRHGIHFTPERFRGLGFENQTPYIFDSDADRNGFEWA